MNISGVSSVQSFQSQNISSNNSQNELSDDQKDLVSSILEEYDSDSLTQADAMEIASSFQEAGITPSRDLANTMAESGFSASEVGELAGVAGVAGTPPSGGMPPPPPSSQSSEEEEYAISSLLETLMNADEDEDTSSSDESIANYTGQIMSLTDNVKQQVQDLFESYKSENTELSTEDAAKVVVNSLTQILSDSNNYKNTSYYA